MQATITTFDNTAEGWERSLYAFLAEKERRSGSRRTVEGYSRMLQHFFASVGKPPDRVTSPEVFAWGYGVGLSGKQPSSVTIGARLACLSSFYRFLIRMDVVSSNPCDALERPRVQVAPPRGLSADDIRKLLAVIPETPVGLRDRAIILTLTLTGRRRAEVLNMTAGDLSQEDDRVWYRCRGKGNKQGKRELPHPAYEALTAALSAFGRDIAAMAPGCVVVAVQRARQGRHVGDLLREPAALPQGSEPAARRRAHLPPLGRQAAARRRREHRERISLPRPLVAAGDVDLPQAVGG
jgi:site-specific recombinase XerD